MRWLQSFAVFFLLSFNACIGQLPPKIPCDAEYHPEDCELPNLPLSSLTTLEDFDRCAPAVLPIDTRNYFWGAAGRELTYYDNVAAYKRIRILNNVLRDVSNNHLETTVLGQKIAFPVGVSPSAAHMLATPEGENATAKGVAAMDTIYILSSVSTVSLEQVAATFKAQNSKGHLWMQTYIFENRTQLADILKRAERNGFEAVVVTVDSPIDAINRCDGRGILTDLDFPNFFNNRRDYQTAAATFKDLTWICSMTKLPVVAKGIYNADDAVKAARACASAILVSNHGGRQLDSAPATIDALPEVVKAMRRYYPNREVYVDGGVRRGNDVYKALLRGARMVFVGRPIVWGLSVAAAEGVQKVLTILRDQFNETMLIAGYSNPKEIQQDSGQPSITFPPFSTSETSETESTATSEASSTATSPASSTATSAATSASTSSSRTPLIRTTLPIRPG